MSSYPTPMKHEDRCKKVTHHLSRIQGQIESLKTMIKEGESCEKVAQLTNSVLRSFGSARASIIEGYILHEVLGDKEVSSKKAAALADIISLYKS